MRERHREKAPERASLGALGCYDVRPEVTSKLATHTSPCQRLGRGHRAQAALHRTQRQERGDGIREGEEREQAERHCKNSSRRNERQKGRTK